MNSENEAKVAIDDDAPCKGGDGEVEDASDYEPSRACSASLMNTEELLIEAEEAIVFLEDDWDSLVAKAAEVKATLLSNDRDVLGGQGCVTLDAQLAILAEIFGDEL